MQIRREVTVQRTARFIQGCGKFDLPTAATTVQTWDVDVSLPSRGDRRVMIPPAITIAAEMIRMSRSFIRELRRLMEHR